MATPTTDPRGLHRRPWPLNPLLLVELAARDVVHELTAPSDNNAGPQLDEYGDSLLFDMTMPHGRPFPYAIRQRRPGRYRRGRALAPRVPGRAVVESGTSSSARPEAPSLQPICKKPRISRKFWFNGSSSQRTSASLPYRERKSFELVLIVQGVASGDSQAGGSNQETRSGLSRSAVQKTGVKSHNEKHPPKASKSLPNPSNNRQTSILSTVSSASRLYSSGQSLSRATSNLHPSRVPLSLTPGRPSVVFLSQIFPPSFNQRKRFHVRQIFLFDAPYIPACVVKAPGHSPRSFYGNLWDNFDLLGTRAFQSQDLPPRHMDLATAMHLGPKHQGWPKDRVPTEVYRRITEFLPRDSIENVRLVCKEFEVNISLALFESVVVPFRSEIYGMINASRRLVKDVEGKGKEKETDEEILAIGDAPFGIYDQKLKIGSVLQGMLVFKGWGPRIKKFAMVFEVDGGKLIPNLCAVRTNTLSSLLGCFDAYIGFLRLVCRAKARESRP